MPEFLTGWPFWATFAFMYLVATLRGQGTYWLGRFVTEQTLRRVRPKPGWQTAAHEALAGEGTHRGVQAIHRWGLPIIPLCYLTVGFQTMVLAGAGVLRISWPVFTLVQLPGALAWATIYSTIGWAMWNAAIAAAAGSPAGIAALVAAMALTVWLVLRRRARRRGAECEPSATPVEAATPVEETRPVSGAYRPNP